MLHEEDGPEIDSFDCVFRMNLAPTTGFERYVGGKTTFRVIRKTITPEGVPLHLWKKDREQPLPVGIDQSDLRDIFPLRRTPKEVFVIIRQRGGRHERDLDLFMDAMFHESSRFRLMVTSTINHLLNRDVAEAATSETETTTVFQYPNQK